MDTSEQFLDKLISWLDNWLETDAGWAAPHLTQRLYPYQQLFSPITVNGLRIKNRIVLGPMGNVYMADQSGRPSRKMIDFLSERARGGAGLITTGLVPVGQGVDPGLTEPGELSLFPRIDSSRTLFSGWRTLAENVHSYGARIFIQLSPGAGRVGSPLPLLTKQRLPVSASWNPNFYLPAVPCRPLWGGEVRRLIRRMGQAAADAKELGMDGAYIHGHEGYLLDQFSNPAFNRGRLDGFRNYQRFAVDTVREIRARTGGDYPIMYRIGLSAALRAVYGEKIEKIRSLRRFRGERTIAQTLALLEALVAAGVDMVDVDLGVYDNWWLPHPPNGMPAGCYLAISRLVKEYLQERGVRANSGQPLAVVAVGKLGYPDLAEEALRKSDCDMVMLARPLLADPDWPAKVYAGRVEDIRPCIGDQEACLKAFVVGTHVQCAVNPRAGFEDILPRDLTSAKKKKKIAVIGGGPAGLTFALTAAERGHMVHIFEKKAAIGGMLLPGSQPLMKYEVRNYLDYLRREVKRMEEGGAIQVYLNTQPTLDKLKESAYDALVVCPGGAIARPKVPGSELSHVIDAVRLLERPERVRGGNQAVVIGGGTVGCETAYWLAAEKKCAVTVLEMLPVLMKDTVTANRAHLLYLLEKTGVRVINCARLISIDEQAVVVEQNAADTVPDPYNTWQPVLPENVPNPLERKIKEQYQCVTLHADMVVMAAGLMPDDHFYQICVAAQTAPEVHILGDAFQIGRVHEAVKAGYTLGANI